MSEINWARVTDECVARLSRLLQFDTTNPPGDETPAARWIEAQLQAAGIATEFFEPGPGRGNVVGRIGPAPGSASADQGLLLLGHTDVVPARAEEWSHHPFSGDVAGGCVWGRGALDMKGTVAMWLTLVLLAQERGLPLRRPLVFMANADEEEGGEFGARWVAQHRPDLVRVAACLNEGGGRGQRIGDGLFFTYQTAEKTPCPVRLVARGRPGHASAPHEDNAVVHLARAVAAIGGLRLPIRYTPTVRAYFEGVAAAQPPAAREQILAVLDPERADAAIDAAFPEPAVRARTRAMIRDTGSPTMLRAGMRLNVIPSQAVCDVDCRILPGTRATDLAAGLREALREAGIGDEVEVELGRPDSAPSESPVDGPLVDALRFALARHAPEGRLVPFMSNGATDGRFFRPLGVSVYGFSPSLPGEAMEGVHGIDERISIRSLEFGLKVAWDVIVRFCT